MYDPKQLRGVVVPLVTPLTADECVDESALRKLVDYVLAGDSSVNGDPPVNGIFVNSTTGEGLALLDEEKDRALEIVVDQAKGRTTIFAGISDVSTRRTLALLDRVIAGGAEVAVAHPPFYYPCNDQSELVDYYTEIAGHAKIPLMLYNIPSTTKTAIEPDTVRRLMSLDQIVGIKDSSMSYLYLLRLIEMKRELRPDFRIFIGKTQLWTAGVAAGADGMLDGISNLIPGLSGRLFRLVEAGRLAEAFKLQEKVNAVWDIYQAPSFLSAIKTAMNLIGIGEPTVSHPVLKISDAEVERIRKILQEQLPDLYKERA